MQRVLVVSYYFPPSGGPGVQRVLKFVKYLPAYGWRPTVLTVDPAHASYPDLDPTLGAEVPPDVDVVRTRSWDPYALYARMQGKPKEATVGVGFIKDEEAGWAQRLARWLRANVFVPDARLGWVPFAVRAAHTRLRRERFDVLLTSGPPHSTHLAGWLLHRRHGIPWVVDMRDPWTDISYYEDLPRTAFVHRLESAMERAVLGTADAVLSVSDGVGRLLTSKADVRRYETIPNGFDPADLPAGPAPAPDPARFVIAHVGTLAAVQHAPGLVEALRRRAAADPAWRARLRLRFVGHVDAAVVAAFREAGFGDALELVPYVPHPEALREMQRADVLLVFVQRVAHNEGVTPAKMFEYLALGRPLLALAPPDGDLAAILRATGGGAAFDHADAGGIEAFLARHAVPPPDPGALRAYDRRVLTERLAGVLGAVARAS